MSRLSVAGVLDVIRDDTSNYVYDAYRVRYSAVLFKMKRIVTLQRGAALIDNDYSASPNFLTLRNIEKSMDQNWVSIVKWHVDVGTC